MEKPLDTHTIIGEIDDGISIYLSSHIQPHTIPSTVPLATVPGQDTLPVLWVRSRFQMTETKGKDKESLNPSPAKDAGKSPGCRGNLDSRRRGHKGNKGKGGEQEGRVLGAPSQLPAVGRAGRGLGVPATQRPRLPGSPDSGSRPCGARDSTRDAASAPPAPSSAQLGRSRGPERPTRPPAGQRRAPPRAASARSLRGPTRTQLGS